MKGQCGDLRNTMMPRRRFIRPSGGRRIADRISGSAEGVYSGANQISSREGATNFGVTHAVLFVCTSNRLRSPTAETLFTGWSELEVSSAGLDPAATRVVDEGVIAAADVIFVMEQHHRDNIRKRFRSVLGERPVYVLGIPDEYEREQPELIALL